MAKLAITFEQWMEELNALTVNAYGMSYDDLPDLFFTRDAYDDGVSPEEFFDDKIGSMEQMQEEMFS